MWKAIPWETIGPAAIVAIVILAIVFGFMLRWKKLEKTPIAPSNPPRDINSTNKKTLCFTHEGKIAANTKAIEIFGGALRQANKDNSEQHGKIFDKMEDLKTTIIKEIHKANGGQ